MIEHDWRHKANPWEPADYDPAVIYAVRAVNSGTANAGHQKLFWAWLMHVAGEDDWPYRPDDHGGQRATDVALGKQLVGKQIKKMLDARLTPNESQPVTVARPAPTRPVVIQGKRGKKKRR